MPRVHFYHTVLRKHPTTGVVEPLEDFIAEPFEVNSSGTEAGSMSPGFSARTGASLSSRISDANGVISFWLEPGDYNVHVSDTEVPNRIADFVVGVNSVSDHQIDGLQTQVTALGTSKEPSSSFVLDLPASPVDGQTVFYRPPVEDSGVATAITGPTTVKQAATVWQLRWVAGGFSGVDDGPTGRWVFVGGSAISRHSLFVRDFGSGATYPLSTWFVDTAAIVKPPLPGFYELTVGARYVNTTGAGVVSSASVKAVRGSGSTWTTASGWAGAPSLSFKSSGQITHPLSMTRDVDLSDLTPGEQLAVAINTIGPDIMSISDANLRLRPVWLVPFS